MFRKSFIKQMNNLDDMETSMRCQLCGKKTHELRYWLDKTVCKRCYELNRVRSEVILEASAN
jgi:formylmethanofuran dehydrogenase subunit E